MIARSLPLLPLLLFSTGCGSFLPGPSGSPASGLQVRTDEGAVCVHSSQPEPFELPTSQSFAEGAPVYLQFTFPECLSSSCDTEREAFCELSREGETFIVSTHAAWRSNRNPLVGCTEDCGRLGATCQTPPLGAGTYTVRHGGNSVTFTVPSELDEAPCTARPIGG